MINSRPSQTISSLATSSDIPLHNVRMIRFRHPGYPTPNILFRLAGFDSPQGGLHHETARTICGIVAGNRWDGYLSETPAGNAINVPSDGLLEKDDYLFVLHQVQGWYFTTFIPYYCLTINLGLSDAPSTLHRSSSIPYPSSAPTIAALGIYDTPVLPRPDQIPPDLQPVPSDPQPYPIVPSFRH